MHSWDAQLKPRQLPSVQYHTDARGRIMATFHISLSLAPADTCMMIVQLAVCVLTTQSTTTHHALNQITAHVRRRRRQPKCGTGEEVGRVFSHTEGAMMLAIWICTGGGILSQNKFLVEASYMHSSWCLLNEFKPMISKLNFDVELKLYHKLILITFF